MAERNYKIIKKVIHNNIVIDYFDKKDTQEYMAKYTDCYLDEKENIIIVKE